MFNRPFIVVLVISKQNVLLKYSISVSTAHVQKSTVGKLVSDNYENNAFYLFYVTNVVYLIYFWLPMFIFFICIEHLFKMVAQLISFDVIFCRIF